MAFFASAVMRTVSIGTLLALATTFAKSEVLSLFVLPAVVLVVRHNYMTVGMLWLILTVMISISYLYYNVGALEHGISTVLLFFCAGGCIALLTMAPAVAEKELLRRHKETRWGTVLPLRRTFFLFPALWTVTWILWRAWMPFGSWGDWASTLKGISDPLVQVAALFGLAGIDFLLAWWAQVTAELIAETPDLLNQEREANDADDEGSYLLGANRAREARSFHNKHIRLSVFAVAVILALGSVRLSEVEQNNEQHPTLGLACALAPPSTVDNRTDEMLRLTSTLGPYAKIVLWSEGALDLQSDKEYKKVQRSVMDIASHTKSFVGFTYTIPNERGKRLNMIELVDMNYTRVFEYQKTHLVFPVETFSMESGPGRLPFKEIAIPVARHNKQHHELNVSAAICHDMDHPTLLQQAANAKLVLSPAATWSSLIGLKHLQMTSIRAVEEGIWILRCDAGGVSGLIDDLGRVRSWQVSYAGETNSMIVKASLFTDKRNTLYSLMSGLPLLGSDWLMFLVLAGVAFFASGPEVLVQHAYGMGDWVKSKAYYHFSGRANDPSWYTDSDF